jgi:DASS family divalent anion:Na+ symporter
VTPWRGNLILAVLVALGFVVGSMAPPSGLDVQGWRLLVLFLMTIVGVILSPKPLSVIALLGGLVAVLTHVLPLSEILQEFSSKVVWLVVLAFFIAQGFVKTGLGRRVALTFIRLLGRTTLGLGYGLALTELMLAPMIPSVTARSGGIVFPIAHSVIEGYAAGAAEADRRSLTAYLMSVCFHANVICCAMFLTAMAGNPLAVQLASQNGITLTWGTWALGAIVPGLCSLALMPWLLLRIMRPTIRASKVGLASSTQACSELGPLSSGEWRMLGVFVLLLVGWIGEPWIGYDATTVALLGVVVLLITHVISWTDAVSEKGAWDTLVWFAVLLSMTGALSKHGVMTWLDQSLQTSVGDIHWPISALVLCSLYFFLHVLFTSATAHISALYLLFLGLMLRTGAPPLFSAAVLAYLASLSASLTHYGNSSAPIFFHSRAVSVPTWWKVGFVVGTLNLILWSSVGAIWWHWLGWTQMAG